MSESIFSIFPNEHYVDLNLYQFGWEQCAPLHSYGPFCRNHYLFHYIISGTGLLDSTDSKGKNRIYRPSAGQGFFICPNQVNTYSADEENPWEYTWLEFDGLRVKEFLESAGLTFDSPIFVPQNPALGEEVKNEMLYIAHNPAESSIHIMGHMYLFLDALVKASSNPAPVKVRKLKDHYVREAISYMEQNYQNAISVEEIASWCNLDRSYFGKIFKETTLVSPQEFLIRCRMAKAASLLKFSDLPVGIISASVGYPNQLHFSRAFKKEYGISPREWRGKNRCQRQ